MTALLTGFFTAIALSGTILGIVISFFLLAATIDFLIQKWKEKR